jgi:hypothetical protein
MRQLFGWLCNTQWLRWATGCRSKGAQSVEGAQPGVAGADIGGGAATEGGAAQGGVIGEEKDKTNQEAGVGEVGCAPRRPEIALV